MAGANAECFLGSYVEALQVIPQQMQTEISSYLQSDLQHQHLLRLSKQYVEELKRATSLVEQKAFAKKLVICLIAIQDICDKRMPMICDRSQRTSCLIISPQYIPLCLLDSRLIECSAIVVLMHVLDFPCCFQVT
ncbi:hypothetical protein P879_11314 [Paragonimus westermani]|uniref:Uncharacterized protein n=1 Tax=Paragonimus westermani TaxID=34504 RepID=A0A8T0DEI7_9TREM|nr:hypothetical protein P879_11314 [Paragonimus westermani]